MRAISHPTTTPGHPRRALTALVLAAALAAVLGPRIHAALGAARDPTATAAPAATPPGLADQRAWAAVRGLLRADERYAVAVADQGPRWVVTFEPQSRLRGGGARVTLDKASLAVLEVVPLR